MTSRRAFLIGGISVATVATLPRLAKAGEFAPAPGAWRNFRLETTLEVQQSAGAVQAWIPLPAFNQPAWIRSGDSSWTTNAQSARLVTAGGSGAQMLAVQWRDGEAAPKIVVASTFATRDRAVDLAKRVPVAALSADERQRYLAPTDLIPTDGIVKAASDRITGNAGSDLEKTRAVYDWVVENTFRNGATRGCGTGNIVSMLQTGFLGGKCADLNALFVGLLRAAGVPARDIYGLRVAPSKFGYKSLGANSEIVTKAQHCRAEVYLNDFGWVPMDPADVRKVALEEPPGKLAMNDEKVVAARKTLFGAWEGNWLAYNDAHDVVLPGAKGPKLGFLMYPQAEVAGVRLDCLDPDKFRYSIKSTEVAI